MRDKLGKKIVTKFIGLRAKTYSYLIDDGSKNKKAKSIQLKKKKTYKKHKIENYKNSLEAIQVDNKIKYLAKKKKKNHIVLNRIVKNV